MSIHLLTDKISKIYQDCFELRDRITNLPFYLRIPSYIPLTPAVAYFGAGIVYASPEFACGYVIEKCAKTTIEIKYGWDNGNGFLRTVSSIAIAASLAPIDGLLATLIWASVGCGFILTAALIPPAVVIYETHHLTNAVCNAIADVSQRICNAVQSRYGNYNPANCN